MAKKQTCSVTVTFISNVEVSSDSTQIKAAYKDLSKQIQTFAESLAADPNIIIAHSKINGLGEAEGTVDAKIAELQTINAKIEQGKSSVKDPTYKSKFEPKVVDKEEEVVEKPDAFDEKPRIKTGHWTPPVKNTPAPVVVPPPKPVNIDTGLKGKMEVTIFKDLKKTEKSAAIIGFFLANPDKQVSVAEIAEGSKVDNKAVSIWLSTTAKESVKAIKNVGRGLWFFDSAKVKVS